MSPLVLQALLASTKITLQGLPLGLQALLTASAMIVGTAIGWQSAPRTPHHLRYTEVVLPRPAESATPVIAATPSAIAAESTRCRASGRELYAGPGPNEVVCIPPR